jgi:hypothetical protein
MAHANQKNMTKALAEIINKSEHPESAHLKASLRFETHNPGYSSYIESIEAKIDNGFGYKGRHEESGRRPGSRIELVNGKYIAVNHHQSH